MEGANRTKMLKRPSHGDNDVILQENMPPARSIMGFIGKVMFVLVQPKRPASWKSGADLPANHIGGHYRAKRLTSSSERVARRIRGV